MKEERERILRVKGRQTTHPQEVPVLVPSTRSRRASKAPDRAVGANLFHAPSSTIVSAPDRRYIGGPFGTDDWAHLAVSATMRGTVAPKRVRATPHARHCSSPRPAQNEGDA